MWFHLKRIPLVGDVNKHHRMPPKKKKDGKGKKGKKGQGKGKKKEGDGAELLVDELYKRTVQEVDCLKEQLAERHAYARRSRASEEVMRDQLMETRFLVEEEKTSKKELGYDLTRQYKTMQTHHESRIEFLESQIRRLQHELDGTRQSLLRVSQERDRLQREKEEEVATLNSKLQAMERSYEAILQDALDALASKIETARTKWDAESQLIEQRTHQVLLEFGCSPDLRLK